MQMHLPDYLLTDLVSTVAFGIVAILLIVLGYVTFDKLTPKLDFNDLLNKGNVAWRSWWGPSSWPVLRDRPRSGGHPGRLATCGQPAAGAGQTFLSADSA